MCADKTDLHQGLPVAGYQPQSSEKVDLVNAMKELEETILRELDDMATGGHCDPEWLAAGRHRLQVAFMEINRSIFQPARVSLPFDKTEPA